MGPRSEQGMDLYRLSSNDDHTSDSMEPSEFSTMYSDEMWEKFELPPTPPRSPNPGKTLCDIDMENYNWCSCMLEYGTCGHHYSLSIRNENDSIMNIQCDSNCCLPDDIVRSDAMWSVPIENKVESPPGPRIPVINYDRSRLNSWESDGLASYTQSRDDSLSHCTDDECEEIDVVGTKKEHRVSFSVVEFDHGYNAKQAACVAVSPLAQNCQNLTTKSCKLASCLQKPDSVVPSNSPNKKSRKLLCSEGRSARTAHNVLEKKRRTDLKNSYINLKLALPQFDHNLNERTPKVVILNTAKEYINALKVEEKLLKKEYDVQRFVRDKLKRKLKYYTHHNVK